MEVVKHHYHIVKSDLESYLVVVDIEAPGAAPPSSPGRPVVLVERVPALVRSTLFHLLSLGVMWSN